MQIAKDILLEPKEINDWFYYVNIIAHMVGYLIFPIKIIGFFMNFIYLAICFVVVLVFKIYDLFKYLLFKSSFKLKFIIGITIAGVIWQINNELI